MNLSGLMYSRTDDTMIRVPFQTEPVLKGKSSALDLSESNCVQEVDKPSTNRKRCKNRWNCVQGSVKGIQRLEFVPGRTKPWMTAKLRPVSRRRVASQLEEIEPPNRLSSVFNAADSYSLRQ
jgi:hypothetical protein